MKVWVSQYIYVYYVYFTISTYVYISAYVGETYRYMRYAYESFNNAFGYNYMFWKKWSLNAIVDGNISKQNAWRIVTPLCI